ncbi:ATP-binding protein [Hydrogenimonas thermophila]|uniref:ATP-binding protein n=1 Tax=Hydrogenimonas thermophila TaxID=223786 RepID=UPI0029374A45|nr:ATP-binding protein [Hydrogenimonas thermophila]WOE68961.1 ATP-binding protein [Hydrogenimonas thermophila]WOE71468.1 ATP-binding protein [Hydrogenimonas thermophila]
MFINRTNELKKLEDEYSQLFATFSVIYGRRRVGKTALISKFIVNKPHIYLYITQGDLKSQLEIFTKEIKKYVDEQVARYLNFESFEEAIEFLATIKFKEKLVFVIDEYQYLVQQDRAFSSKLQRVWDLKLQNSNIYLILCGSVLSMMQSEVLNYSAPLYGRRTSQFHIKPLLFKNIKEFIPKVDKLEQMYIFSSFGTIPKYLNEYDQTKPFIKNIEEKILDKNSYLYSEGNFLLKDDIGDVASYFNILKAIADGNRKVGSIASALGVHSSYLSKYMQKLVELDIVVKETPVLEKNPLKSKFGQYRIKDKFLNFWFFYVYKNYSYLEIGEVETVLNEIETNFNDRFVSFAFEDYVIEEIIENPLNYLSFVPLKVGRWWNNKNEIDIVAYDEKNIAFIECKWQNRVNKESELRKLIEKAKDLTDGKRAYYLIATKEDYLNDNLLK